MGLMEYLRSGVQGWDPVELELGPRREKRDEAAAKVSGKVDNLEEEEE